MVTFVATPLFGYYASRTNRQFLFSGLLKFFLSNIVLFIVLFGVTDAVCGEYVDRNATALQQQNATSAAAHIWLARLFYIWLSLFSLQAISSFWSFMNELAVTYEL